MREIFVVGAAIVRKGRCLVARRGANMSAPGRWEFPGGKVEFGETARDALQRELREELAIGIEVHESLGVGTVEEPTRRIVLEVFRAKWIDGTLNLREHAEVRWVGADDLDGLDWADADRPVLPAVRALLEGHTPATDTGARPA